MAWALVKHASANLCSLSSLFFAHQIAHHFTTLSSLLCRRSAGGVLLSIVSHRIVSIITLLITQNSTFSWFGVVFRKFDRLMTRRSPFDKMPTPYVVSCKIVM